MRTTPHLTHLLLGLAALPLLAGENQLTPGERAAGWRLLFDGATTDGWLEITGKPFPRNCWTVEDGCLRALVRTDGSQDIRTVDTFRSFDLRFDWKLEANGNSGVKYRIQKVDEWVNKIGRQARARGFEYQLVDERNPEAADPRRLSAALYSLLAPNPKIPAAIGAFNHSRILVKGDHVEHWLNGVKVVEFETTDPRVQKVASKSEDTPISLQNHTSPVWFRNLKIRPLD